MHSDLLERLTEHLAGIFTDLPGRWPFTGGTLAILERDGRHHVAAFGHTFEGAPMAKSARFQIGSISKTFTGLMVTELARQGRCDLNAPVGDYLPWFKLNTEFAPPTLRHLLHHSAGLVKGADDPPDELGQCWSLRNTITGTPPGTFFHYSNLGYILLGLVIGKLTGRHASDHCREMLTGPLGMSDTLSRITNADRSAIATGTVPEQDDRPWAPGDPLAPAPWLEAEAADGNIASNADDMIRFMKMLLADGQSEGQAILTPGTIAAATADLSVGGEDFIEGFCTLPVTSSRYGYGVNVETIAGNLCLTHGGGMVGHSSFMLVDRTAGLGICVLTNANGGYPVAQTLARLAHATMVAGKPLSPTLDLDLRKDDTTFDVGMLGSFAAEGDGPGPERFAVSAEGDEVVLFANGRQGRLFKTWGTRVVTDHPDLRRFHLGFTADSGGMWSFGGRLYVREGCASPDVPPNRHSGCVGRYRSYSPWCPTFRIVLRAGRLFLTAPGGVEAPDEDMELIELSLGIYRIGADERLPERLILGPMVDGRPISATRDGCRYSRMSND